MRINQKPYRDSLQPDPAVVALRELASKPNFQRSLEQRNSPGCRQGNCNQGLREGPRQRMLPSYVGIDDMGAQDGVVRFQPTVTIEAAGSGTKEAIQPSDMWIRGCQFPTYHMQVEIIENSANAEVYLESAPTAEGPFDTVKSFTAVTNTMIVISSEGGENKFTGLLRWRVAGTAPWQACFQFHAMPGASVSDKFSTPIRP